MTTLSGTLGLKRAVLTEVTEDPNVEPRIVVSGTSATVQASSGGQTKMEDFSQSGSFRQYGNGNTRLILGSGTSRTQSLALIAISEDDVEVLKALLGHTVCYRTKDGVKMFGAFLDMAISRIPNSGGLVNVGLTIQEVTYDEEV
jgi:hypothetical protein